MKAIEACHALMDERTHDVSMSFFKVKTKLHLEIEDRCDSRSMDRMIKEYARTSERKKYALKREPAKASSQ